MALSALRSMLLPGWPACSSLLPTAEVTLFVMLSMVGWLGGWEEGVCDGIVVDGVFCLEGILLLYMVVETQSMP